MEPPYPVDFTPETEIKSLKQELGDSRKSCNAAHGWLGLLIIAYFVTTLLLVMWCWLPAKWDLEKAQRKLDNPRLMKKEVLDLPIVQADILKAYFLLIGFRTEGGYEPWSLWYHKNQTGTVSRIVVHIPWSEDQDEVAEEILHNVWKLKSLLNFNQDTVEVSVKHQSKKEYQKSIIGQIELLKTKIIDYAHERDNAEQQRKALETKRAALEKKQ